MNRRIERIAVIAARCLVAPAVVFGLVTIRAVGVDANTNALPSIAANDNRHIAGVADGAATHVDLTARLGRWFPYGKNSLGVPIAAFGETGRAPQIPAPLLRVPAGSTITVRLHNALSRTIAVHGMLVDAGGDHPIVVRSGTSRTVSIRRTKPGTYSYWTSDERVSQRSRFDEDAELNGAIVIDDPQRPKPTDRVIVIGDWDHVWHKDGSPNFAGEVLTLNGLAWPATERFAYVHGETVRWRMVNGSLGDHPMHLHGFPFTLDATGDGLRVQSFAGKPSYREVTHLIASGDTFDMHWVADRIGSWMFHCHMAVHLAPNPPLAPLIEGKPPESHGFEAAAHFPDGMMGGLNLAVVVVPKHGETAIAHVAPERTLRLDIVTATKPQKQRYPLDRFSYVLHEDGVVTQSTGSLGPLMVLTAGVPVAIDVTNHLSESTTVHWHGIAVQNSIDDGGMAMTMPAIGAISPNTMRDAPAIRPGATFIAQFTPPQSGTFMYHTHMDDTWQLASGLSGPLIVLPKGAHYDASSDHIVMITSPSEHPFGDAVNFNGSDNPAPIVAHVGVLQRLRLINMTVLNADLVVSLDGANAPFWTPVAKDGMDLDPRLRSARRAVQRLTVGETRDVTFMPTIPGHYTLGAFDGGPVGSIALDVVP